MPEIEKTHMQAAEYDALREVEKRIETARTEHWQKHLYEHPYTDGSSCPRDYGIHDAYAHAANIVRAVIRERAVPPPATSVRSSGQPIDLLGALQRSVDAAKTEREERS